MKSNVVAMKIVRVHSKIARNSDAWRLRCLDRDASEGSCQEGSRLGGSPIHTKDALDTLFLFNKKKWIGGVLFRIGSG
jgi:hypothetical protein